MVFNAVFNSISFISWLPVHLSMVSRSSFNQYPPTIFFPSHWLLSHITIVETTDSGDRGRNPLSMTIINSRKEYWPSPGSSLQCYLLSYWAQLCSMKQFCTCLTFYSTMPTFNIPGKEAFFGKG